MKLNSTPRHYMLLSQSQSDDDELGSTKDEKQNKLYFKNSFVASDEVSKAAEQVEIDEVDPKSLPMSQRRKCAFILSLISCFLFVTIFVFFIPCDNYVSLDDTWHLTEKWASYYYNMTFISPLDYCKNSEDYIIIFGYKTDESGIISIDGSSGKMIWKQPLHSLPAYSICNAIDVNADGIFECIIMGSNGLLTAIDVKTGTSFWYLHNHKDVHEIISIEKPIVMPDCDDDDVLDLFVPSINIKENSLYFAVVSGGTGQVIGSYLKISECSSIVTPDFKWHSENETFFILYCKENGYIMFLSSTSVCDVALNTSGMFMKENVFRLSKYVSNISFYKPSSTDNILCVIVDNEILLLKKRGPKFHLIWNLKLEFHKNIRIIADGMFSSGFNELIILSNFADSSKITGVSIIDGKDVWSITQEKGSITSAFKLAKIFGNSDGLLVKVILFSPFFSQDIETNSTVKDTRLSKNATVLEENYHLVKPEKNPLITNLYTERVWAFCESDICFPDVYTPNSTVLVQANDEGISVDILAVSSSAYFPNNSLHFEDKISIKLWNLESICYLSRCSSFIHID